MTDLYDDRFYQGQRARSRSSARVVIPIVQGLVKPKSVLDVGCGVGTWAGEWIAAGVDDVLGVDGDYVNRAMLEIPEGKFVGHDLSRPLDLGRRFDLVECVEVAEHLPAGSARMFVESLTRHSDAVVFSAAVPYQGGTNHVNEQWPSYWAKQFERVGYRLYDPFRAAIWDNDEVEWWYRQNLFLFVAEDSSINGKLVAPTGPIDVVHPLLFKLFTDRPIAPPSKISQRLEGVRSALRRTGAGRVIRAFRDDARSRRSGT